MEVLAAVTIGLFSVLFLFCVYEVHRNTRLIATNPSISGTKHSYMHAMMVYCPFISLSDMALVSVCVCVYMCVCVCGVQLRRRDGSFVRVSIGRCCLVRLVYAHTHTHTHAHIYIYIVLLSVFTLRCVCACV